MCESGIASFRAVDAASLHEGDEARGPAGLLVAVHAEDEGPCPQVHRGAKGRGPPRREGVLASRPVEVELAAIRQALEFAARPGCALHIVHVSSPEGLALITAARAARVDVTAETSRITCC